MSALEDELAAQLRLCHLPEFVREYRFHSTRMWRFDFCWPDLMLAVEIEGGIWTNGAHTRGRHYSSDCEKYNEAMLAGYRLLRVTGDQVRSGEALKWLERAINGPQRGGEAGRGSGLHPVPVPRTRRRYTRAVSSLPDGKPASE